MAEYHVGCGAFAIYAGTLNAKNKNYWQSKTECTMDEQRNTLFRSKFYDDMGECLEAARNRLDEMI